MNYYGAKELAASFRTVRKNTIAIAEEIGEEHYNFSATPDTQTVAQTLAHLALNYRWPMQVHATDHLSTFVGYDFMAFFGGIAAEEKKLNSKHVIVAELKAGGEKFATWLDGLTDDFLAEQMTMMTGMTPPTKTRFEMLLGVKEHEMHHRAQLMVLERLVGIVPHMTRESQARMAAMTAAKAKA